MYSIFAVWAREKVSRLIVCGYGLGRLWMRKKMGVRQEWVTVVLVEELPTFCHWPVLRRNGCVSARVFPG